ncbi:MAG: M23 family metallopeptidase [Firmicutes bacterium]|nr:M23 family metallopeptidase [Bacillota bacterium]
MLEKFRQKSFPRFHLRARLDEYDNLREKRYWGEGGEFEGRGNRSFFDLFPFSVLKEMHSFLLFKVTFVVSIILIVFLLSLLNFSFARALIKNINYLTTWKTDFIAIGRKAAPVISDLWEGNPERGLAVLAPLVGERKEEGSVLRFAMPLEGRVVKNFGYGYNPKLQMDDMTYGIVFSASGERDITASAAGKVSKIKNDPYYGLLLVLQHSGGMETCYGYLKETYVKEGEEVRQGARIARTGPDMGVQNSFLYFEARDKGKPFDPLPYLTEQSGP